MEPQLCHLGALRAGLPAAVFLQGWSHEVFGALKGAVEAHLATSRLRRLNISQRASSLGWAPWAYHISQCGWLLAHSSGPAQRAALARISSLITQHLRYCALTTQMNLFAAQRRSILTRARLAITPDLLLPQEQFVHTQDDI